MIPKSGYRFSEKIMLQQQAKAKYRINVKSFRFSVSQSAAASETCGTAMRLERNAPPRDLVRPTSPTRSAHNRYPGTALRRAPMSEIRKSNGVCTQINVVRLPADNQDEILTLMIERARFMATQPGFISVNLHRSKDGNHVVNYVQWTSADKLAAARHSPEFRKKWPRFGELVKDADPCLYDVVHVEAA
jgi:heme-degrading monooxygenase HmoA